MKTAIKYGATLIGVYLVVFYASGAGRVLQSGGTAAVGLTKALQGR